VNWQQHGQQPQSAGPPAAQPGQAPRHPGAQEFIPKCPYASCPGVFTFCGAELRWVSRGSGFWGCSSFPACDYK
jgi:hypothetical protein